MAAPHPFNGVQCGPIGAELTVTWVTLSHPRHLFNPLQAIDRWMRGDPPPAGGA